MSEPRAMREIHEIRRKIHEETKDLSPEEYAEYQARTEKDIEALELELGYKWVPSEAVPGCMRLIRI